MVREQYETHEHDVLIIGAAVPVCEPPSRRGLSAFP